MHVYAVADLPTGSPCYPLYRRLGGPTASGWFGKEKNLIRVSGIIII